MNTTGLLALALASLLSMPLTNSSQPSETILFPAGTDVLMNTEVTEHECKGKTEEPENAIGKDAAKEKALADAGIRAEEAGKIRARISETDDGTVVYKVKFTVGETKHSYSINALTGAIVDHTAEAVTAEDSAKEMKREKKEEIAEPENAIGKDAAKEKALADAGIRAEEAGKVRARISETDDGTVVYKVKFTVGETKHSYSINALTGAIVDHTAEAVTADDSAKSGRHAKRNLETGSTPASQSGTPAV